MEINNICQFKLAGRMSLNWKDWYPNMTITCEKNTTVLTGNVRDY